MTAGSIAVMDMGVCDVDAKSRAAVMVKLPSGNRLAFCAHHFREREEKLLRQLEAEIVVDERAALH